jgi:hypothetical protein
VVRSQTHPEMRCRLEELTAEAQSLLADYLRARVEVGELRAHASEVVARMLLSTVVMWRLTDAPAEQLGEVVAVLLSGLAVTHPISAAPSSPLGRATQRRAPARTAQPRTS